MALSAPICRATGELRVPETGSAPLPRGTFAWARALPAGRRFKTKFWRSPPIYSICWVGSGDSLLASVRWLGRLREGLTPRSRSISACLITLPFPVWSLAKAFS